MEQESRVGRREEGIPGHTATVLAVAEAAAAAAAAAVAAGGASYSAWAETRRYSHLGGSWPAEWSHFSPRPDPRFPGHLGCRGRLARVAVGDWRARERTAEQEAASGAQDQLNLPLPGYLKTPSLGKERCRLWDLGGARRPPGHLAGHYPFAPPWRWRVRRGALVSLLGFSGGK